MVSGAIERLIFWSRWLLSPLYLGLVGVLVVVVYRFAMDFYKLLIGVGQDHGHNAFVLDLLALLDSVLIANLILIVLFAGYENFVSKIEAAKRSVDRPYWMGTVDFSGMKLKLIGSLVAISVIELLKDFIGLSEHPEAEVGQGTIWRVLIHLTFVVSGVLFSVMDRISESPNSHHSAPEEEAKKPASSTKSN